MSCDTWGSITPTKIHLYIFIFSLVKQLTELEWRFFGMRLFGVNARASILVDHMQILEDSA